MEGRGRKWGRGGGNGDGEVRRGEENGDGEGKGREWGRGVEGRGGKGKGMGMGTGIISTFTNCPVKTRPRRSQLERKGSVRRATPVYYKGQLDKLHSCITRVLL